MAKVVIIGGGPGGYVAAIRVAQLGADVTVVEEHALGGTCLNWGCVPTKTLLHAARVYRLLQDTKKFGVYCTPGPLRFDKMVENKNVVVKNNVAGIEALFKRHRIRIQKGTGQIVDSRGVEIQSEDENIIRETADAVIIATGSEPLVPSFIQLDQDRIITTTEALDLDHVPESIAVIGGSVSGCEFAALFGQLGSKVTLIEMLHRIVPTEDAEISRRLQGALRSLGIKVMTKMAVKALEKQHPHGSVRLIADNKSQIDAEYCLLAMGRKLNTEGIGLERVGIEFSAKGIVVNERMETNVQNVYAVGDVTGKILLAHVAMEQGIVAAENIMGIDSRMDYAAVPSFIYTDPEIGIVGITEEEAKDQGIDVMKGKALFKTNAMAHAIGDTTGFVKTILDRENRKILGIHMVGPHATDLLGEAVTIVKTGLTLEAVREVVHPHPTLPETIKEAVLASVDQAIHG